MSDHPDLSPRYNTLAPGVAVDRRDHAAAPVLAMPSSPAVDRSLHFPASARPQVLPALPAASAAPSTVREPPRNLHELHQLMAERVREAADAKAAIG